MAWVAVADSGLNHWVSNVDALTAGSVAFEGSNLVATGVLAQYDSGFFLCFDDVTQVRITPNYFTSSNPDPEGDDSITVVPASWFGGASAESASFDSSFVNHAYPYPASTWPAGAGTTEWDSDAIEFFAIHSETEYAYAFFIGNVADYQSVGDWSFLVEVWTDAPPPEECFWTDMENATQDCEA